MHHEFEVKIGSRSIFPREMLLPFKMKESFDIATNYFVAALTKNKTVFDLKPQQNTYNFMSDSVDDVKISLFSSVNRINISSLN